MPTLYDNPGSSGYNVYESLESDPITPDYGVMERLAFGGAMLAPRAIHGVGESLDAIGSWIGLTNNEGPEYLPSLPAGTTGGQQIADLAGALAPLAVTIPVGGGLIRGGLAAAGLRSPLATAAITDAALFGAMGAPAGGDVVAEQAAEGAGYGLLTGLPRMQRFLPAAALALGSKMFFDYHQPEPVVGNWTQGDISAAAGFLTAFLPGQIPTKRAPAPTVPTNVEGSLYNVPTPEGNQTLFNSMFPNAGAAPYSAEQSAMAMQDLIAARQTARPPANPDPYTLFGTTVAPFKSAEESAEVMINARAARERAVDLEVFRDNRVIEARYTPPEQRPGYAPESTPVPQEPISTGAIIKTASPSNPDYLRMAFDPANFATLANFAGVPVEAIDAAAKNFSEIQFAQFIREARMKRQSDMTRMARWAAGLGDDPHYQVVDAMWDDVIARGTATPDNPRGLPPVTPEPPLQPAPGEGGTTGMTRSKMRTQPSWQTEQGGFISPEALEAIGMPAIRATVGAGLGEIYNDKVMGGEDDTAWLRGAMVGLLGPRFARTFTAATKQAFGVRQELGGLADKFKGGPLPHNLESKFTYHEDGSFILDLDQKVGEGVTRTRGSIVGQKVGDNTLQIRVTDLDPELQGQAIGSHMYDKLIDEATARGWKVVSDNSVSPEAQAVYAGLMTRGFEVRQNPRAIEMIDKGKRYLVSATGDPIYEVWPKQGNLMVKPGDTVIGPNGKEFVFTGGGPQTRGRKRIILKGEYEDSISAYADEYKTKAGEPILQPLQNPARDRLAAEAAAKAENLTPWQKIQDANVSKSEKRTLIDEAGGTQRGIPESVMMRTSLAAQDLGAPAPLVHAMEHIGDLAHRASRENAIINVKEKVKNFLQFGSPGRWTWEQELDEGWKSNLSYRIIQNDPQLKARWDGAVKGRDKGLLMEEVQRSPEFETQLQEAKTGVDKLLKEYTTAHREHNQPITELGLMGKQAAIALGTKNWPLLKTIMYNMDDWLERYAKASDEEKFAMFAKPAKSDPTAAAAAPSTAGMRRPTGRVDQGGFVMPELTAAMGRGVIGGMIGSAIGGATDDPDERGGMITGGLIGALSAMGGRSIAGAVAAGLAKLKNRKSSPSAPQPRKVGNLAHNFGQQIEEMSGSVISRGSTRIADRFVRWLDTGLELTMPAPIKEALLGAKGAASVLLDTIDSSLLKVSLRFNPDGPVQKIANDYLNGTIDQMEMMKRLAPSIQGNTQVENYAKFLVAGREAINSLQKMVSDGIGDPKKAKIINDSIGKYLTRSYRMFTNSNWRPSEQVVQNLVDELHHKQVWKGATRDDIQNMLRQYVAEVKSVKGMYPKFSFSAQGQKINQAVLKQRLNLSDAWKEFLGEIQNPTERIYQTVFRLRPMAEASSYFNKLSKVADEDGMPVVFRSYAEKDAFKSKVLQQLQNPNLDDATKAKLEFQLTKLSNFMNVESHPKFGELSGQIVNRHVFETLSTYDSFTDVATNPYLRSLVNAHTAIKLARTAFNPLTVIRNFVTTPAFMMIGRTSLQDIGTAWDIVKNAEHPLRAEIMRQGIGNVDQVKTEFFKEFENITGSKYDFGSVDLSNMGLGKIDLDLAEKYGRRGFRGILDAYRLPDNLVRIGAYLSAKRRIAQTLGKALDDDEVIRKATEFTNRYTMNYDAVAPMIKKVRQMPFANLFISYTAEMARIAKNLVEDVVMGDKGDLARHGRMYAAAPLAMLAIMPEMLEESSESSLSDKDRQDWEKAKRLMPDYSRTRFRYVTGRDKKTGQFHFVDFTPLIASDSFNQLVRAVVDGDTEAAVAVNPVLSWDNTPALNIAVEQITGKDSRTHREFRGGADRVAAFAKEVLPPWMPSAGSEWQRFLSAHTTNAEGEMGITNQKTGNRITPSDFWASYFGPLTGELVPPGARVGSTNLDTLEAKAVAEAKNRVANETAYLNDVLKSDANDELKARAVERFKLAVGTIRENLAARLGGSP